MEILSNKRFFMLQIAFLKDQEKRLAIIPLGSPLLFNLPPTLNLDSKERLFLDNVWANNRHPSFTTILTKFANYFHSKDSRANIDQNLRLKSLDAFLEMEHTVQI